MKALDLFCGAGGAAMGLHRAGFEVVGVDIRPQPRFPFAFLQADALNPPFRLEDFDLVWASPPCQAHTTMSNRWRGNGGRADFHENLIPAVREMLENSGVYYVIENVCGARKHLRLPVKLSGEMFGLGVHRPRLFECSTFILTPDAPTPKTNLGIYGKHHDGRLLWARKNGTKQLAPKTLEEARLAMGIDWMEWRELAEAIPPAYSEFIARALLAAYDDKASA